MSQERHRPWDGGTKGYREPGEPSDERPILRRDPFWDDPQEAEAYLWAVHERPIKLKIEEGQFTGYAEPVLGYLREIVKRATGKDVEPVKPMPRDPGQEG